MKKIIFLNINLHSCMENLFIHIFDLRNEQDNCVPETSDKSSLECHQPGFQQQGFQSQELVGYR